MTGHGMCGVFIPDRVLAGWWRSQWKASDRMWAVRCTRGCGRGQVYKCECRWDHCSVLGGCLLFLHLYFIHLPTKMELIECPETSAIRTQTPGNYPKENILHIEQGESLKSRITLVRYR